MYKDRKPDNKGFTDVGNKVEMADEVALKKELKTKAAPKEVKAPKTKAKLKGILKKGAKGAAKVLIILPFACLFYDYY